MKYFIIIIITLFSIKIEAQENVDKSNSELIGQWVITKTNPKKTLVKEYSVSNAVTDVRPPDVIYNFNPYQ